MDSRFIIIVFVMASTTSGAVPDITQFFPEIENDLSRVTWGHAINSKALLDEAISKNSYMMYEADVVKGHLKNETSPSKLIPIMAHPPDKTSDLSLEMWIDSIIKANEQGKKIGAKLDFKDLNIVITSLEILRKKASMLTFPLWLNADILKGPGGEDKTPVDAEIFLSLCTEFFPDATLSLGWTTGYTPGAKQKYTDEMVDEMIETLDRNNINQPVTFPIRAAFIESSYDALEGLNIDKPDYTFTVWTSATDKVDLKGLAKFQYNIGPSAVFFDLPEDEVEELRRHHKEFANSLAQANINSNTKMMVIAFCILISTLVVFYF